MSEQGKTDRRGTIRDWPVLLMAAALVLGAVSVAAGYRFIWMLLVPVFFLALLAFVLRRGTFTARR